MTNLQINDTLRLVPYTGMRNVSLWWYRDAELVHDVLGRWKSYQKADILNMYAWQLARGKLYYIEKHGPNGYYTIGDVWVAAADFAIVLDPMFQRQGIAKKVVQFFLEQAHAAGELTFNVAQVYAWNLNSQKLFRALHFTEIKNELGYAYRYTFA
jgi:GNAT superfamily N-acetyltransferase